MEFDLEQIEQIINIPMIEEHGFRVVSGEKTLAGSLM